MSLTFTQRFEHSASGVSSKIDADIRYSLELDMTPYTTRAKRKTGQDTRSFKPYVYDLISVVVHKGEINSGHYISYCRENGQVGTITAAESSRANQPPR